MTQNKTQATGANVEKFLDGVENKTRRNDARALVDIMRRVTGTDAKMWGPSIIGFGEYHYRYESGREGDFFRVGFSPRKSNLALYLLQKDEHYEELLGRLGKHGTGASCLYVNKLADVDPDVLEELIRRSWHASEPG
jgi:hypothetical protein